MGDILVAGHAWARVRTMIDEHGGLVTAATPATAVQVSARGAGYGSHSGHGSAGQSTGAGHGSHTGHGSAGQSTGQVTAATPTTAVQVRLRGAGHGSAGQSTGGRSRQPHRPRHCRSEYGGAGHGSHTFHGSSGRGGSTVVIEDFKQPNCCHGHNYHKLY